MSRAQEELAELGRTVVRDAEELLELVRTYPRRLEFDERTRRGQIVVREKRTRDREEAGR